MNFSGGFDLHCFILDFPVMPYEKFMVSLKPTSFFDLNPSNDVPRSSQEHNKSTLHIGSESIVGTREATRAMCCANL